MFAWRAPGKLLSVASLPFARDSPHDSSPADSPREAQAAVQPPQLNSSPSSRLRRRFLSWLPGRLGGTSPAAVASSAEQRPRSSVVAQVPTAPHHAPPRRARRRQQAPLVRRVQNVSAAAVAAALPAAEAVALLLQEALQQRQRASVAVTVACLWLVLLLSESALLSQWNVLIAAYVLAFAAPRLYVRCADDIEEACAGLKFAAAQLAAPAQRMQCALTLGAGLAAFWCVQYTAVVRVSLALAASMCVAVWQLQRQRPQR